MSLNLLYNYAYVDNNGLCLSAATYSYQINHYNYIAVGSNFEHYIDKYYNRENGMWYYDATFTQEATELN